MVRGGPRLQTRPMEMSHPIHSQVTTIIRSPPSSGHYRHQVTTVTTIIMTEWTLLKRLLDAVHQHSTMMGRLWLTVMVIFRLLIVAVATEDVYADEQEMFVCNTMQPGCPTVCYDSFAPISQPRFWVFHIISVSTPSLCFIIYTWHSLSKLPHNAGQQGQQGGGKTPGDAAGVSALLGGSGPAADGGQEAYNRSCDSDSCSIRSHKHLGHSLADVLEGLTNQSLQRGDPNTVVSLDQVPLRMCMEEPAPAPPRPAGGVLSKCYVFHVCVRAVLEVGFVLAQWMLFGFRVPVHFLCRTVPCAQPVDCYVSRPTEKTIFLLFMYCVGVFCIVLNLLELNHLGWKKIRRAVKTREEPGGGGGGSSLWASYTAAGGKKKKKKKMTTGYETFPHAPDSPSRSSSSLHSSLGGFRDVTSTASLPTLDLVVGHKPDWTCAGNCGGGGGGGGDAPPLFKEPKLRPAETTTIKTHQEDPRRGERQPLKGKRVVEARDRSEKQRSTEVWI